VPLCVASRRTLVTAVSRLYVLEAVRIASQNYEDLSKAYDSILRI